MNNFGQSIKKVYHNERWMLVLMIINLLLSLALIIYGFVVISPDSPIVKTGYADIGGYRDGVWTDMLAFPLLGLIFGVFHNLIALGIYRKRGAGMTKFFLIVTTALIVGTFIVLSRLVGEA
ncbi:hypothetical protein IJ101_01950 [Candidatus Saccharibacteria bacterium]|jgi:hypothetical protein|nr:hypothetical protein [Candidatus Saccharibacteria bacterium]